MNATSTDSTTTNKWTRSRHAPDPSSLCQFPFADGRTCRMLRHPSHPTLCIVHARREKELQLDALQQQEFEAISAELAMVSANYHSVTEIHHVVSKLFNLVASNRIPRRQAQLLTYLSQLLLYSQQHLRRERIEALGSRNWSALLREIYGLAERNQYPASVAVAQQQAAEKQAVPAEPKAPAKTEPHG